MKKSFQKPRTSKRIILPLTIALSMVMGSIPVSAAGRTELAAEEIETAAGDIDMSNSSEESLYSAGNEAEGEIVAAETGESTGEQITSEQNEETEQLQGAGSLTETPDLSGDSEVKRAKRTIMLYDMGSNLEQSAGLASYNLRQVLRAKFSADDDIRFIVMTGGAKEWKLESEYLYDPATGRQIEKIDTTYNHIWEARGLDAANPAEAGKLVLLDADGVLGDGENAKRAQIAEEDYILDEGFREFDLSKEDNYEWMTNPEVLRAFINYGAEHFPADKYDLILWDHGNGPVSGFGSDEQDCFSGWETLEPHELIDVFSDNAVTAEGGKFDFINFDACLMNCVEYNLMFSDYTDYYIASPESEPGFGQDYEGWLNLLGENPDMDTFEIGKKIVDDFISFYDKEEGDGSSQEGTLAIVNMRALMEKTVNDIGFMEALTALTGILQNELEQEHLYYDEFRSINASIQYGDTYFYDLGNLLSVLSYVYKEADYDLLKNPAFDDSNSYTRIAGILQGILNDPDVIYARNTKGISTDEQYFRDSDGAMSYGKQGTSGMYIAFPSLKSTDDIERYYKAMNRIAEKMGSDDLRAAFFTDISRIVAEYSLVTLTGRAVTELVSRGADKNTIDYTTVKDYWKEETIADYGEFQFIHSPWIDSIGNLMGLVGGEESAEEWLTPVIRQMAEEAISKNNIDVQKNTDDEGTSYRITMQEVRKQVVEDVRMNLVAELPAMQEFLANPAYAKYAKDFIDNPEAVTIGSMSGSEFIDTDLMEQGYEKLLDWYFEPTSIWTIDQPEEKWYAIRDASGTLHVTAAEVDEDEIAIPTGYITRDLVEQIDGTIDYTPVVHVVYLDYHLDDQGEWRLTSLYFMQEDGYREVPVSEYTGELEVCPIVFKSAFGTLWCVAPISMTPFTLSASTLDSITIEYTDIDNITDIADTTGDGKKLTTQMVVRNIYGSEIDISDLAENAGPISIENASVAGVSLSYGYSGKAYTPEVIVKVDGVTLTKDTDYTVLYKNNTDPGTATITITGKGKYTGTRVKTFKIVDCVSKLVSGRTYQLIPKNNSGTAVCPFSGKMINNTKVYITDRSSSEAMRFKAVKNSDGTWKLINAKCELVLAVQQNSPETGKGLVLYDQTTRDAQNWKLSKKSDNSFAIINAVTGYSVAMSDTSAVKGTTLSMAETASSGLQRFYFIEADEVKAPYDGTFAVKAAKDKAYALNAASSSKTDGANVNLYKYSNSNAKKFKVMYSGGGFYRLVNVNSGMCLTVNGNTKTDGANVIQSKWAAQSGQRWKITKNSDGTVTLTNALGTVLHLVSNKTENGSNIVAKKAASTKAQRWYLQ